MKEFLYCSDPLNPSSVDPDYELEYNSCKKYGFDAKLFNFEEILLKDHSKAISKIPQTESCVDIIYRGWMLKDNDYRSIYNKLLDRNYKLINSPDEYLFCHYLPYNYEIIREVTPKTIWFELNEKREYDIDEIMNGLKEFKGKLIILKDYVKSQKHHWKEACFIPDSSEKVQVKKVIDRFIELQSDHLTRGLVFREFVEFEFLNYHPKSNMPLTKEYRLFFYNHTFIAQMNYWDEGNYDNEDISEIAKFKEIARSVKSNFFSMDIAKAKNGQWYIIELGDGQVTGFPGNFNPDLIYEKISLL